jgi:hypothetical protein
MNRGNLIVAVGLAVSVSACAQTAYRITAAPRDKDVSSQIIDSTQCSDESRINTFTRVLFCGVGAAICRSVMDSRYEDCMIARGYRISPIL